MSRCFPFPPPGYERKTITDDPDLLKKEKHREKKHKKEKRDKEKKEGKEKREKERSDEKHREKKDKKDKHKDKKKDKEKHRDKDKHKTDSFPADEKRLVRVPGPQIPVPSETSKDRANNRSAVLVEKRVPGLSASQNGECGAKNSHVAPETQSIKYATEMGWRSTDDEKRTISQMPDRNVGTERKKDGLVNFVGKSPGSVVDGMERSKEKASLDRRTNERAVSGDTRFSGSVQAPNSVGMVQNRVGISRPMERKIDQRMEGKGRNREKEGDDGKVEKRKENDREKPTTKENEREKERRKEDTVKATMPTSEQKHIELSRMEHGSKNHMLKSGVKDGSKKDFSGTQNSGLQNMPRPSNHSSGAVNNPGKRKGIGLNGIHDEHISGPNKLARTTTSTHPSVMENGRSMEACQSSAALAPATQRLPLTAKVDPTLAPNDTQRLPQPVNMNIKVDAKERKINGMITQPSSQSTAKAERKPDASFATARPPHPDTKYLGQILSVPKLDEWSGFDDQEWLFSSSHSSETRKKPAVESSGDDNTPQVWAKALWLEPVDIHALPYVIPH